MKEIFLLLGVNLFGLSQSFSERQERMLSCEADCNILYVVMSHIKHGQGRKGDTQYAQSHTALDAHALGFLHAPFILVYRPRAFWQLLSKAEEQECLPQATDNKFQLRLSFSLFSVKKWVQGQSQCWMYSSCCNPKDSHAHYLLT